MIRWLTIHQQALMHVSNIEVNLNILRPCE